MLAEAVEPRVKLAHGKGERGWWGRKEKGTRDAGKKKASTHTFRLAIITQKRRVQHDPIKLPLERRRQSQWVLKVVVGKFLKKIEALVELEQVDLYVLRYSA